MSDYKINIKIAGQLEKSFSAAMKAANVGLKGLSTIGKIGAAGLTAASTAIAAVTAASVKVGSTFEAAMSSTAATAGATAEEYDKLKAAAMQMGRETSKTATESAQALEYMSLAGWTVDQSIKGLPSILRLSEATGLDLARTSDLVTDSMSACGVTVDELAGYLNICAKANNKSNQTAEQLMEAYIGVGGTMKNLNVPITESATALGILANRGIKGSEAGNALNAVMVNLTSGTGQAGKMMAHLGLSAFDSAGNFKGLKETLVELNARLSGMTQEERNAALAAIGGKQHVDALNDLLQGLNTTTAEGAIEWDALAQELQNADGALEEMAKTKLDNLNGDLAILESALQDTGIKIYDNLNKPLREAVQYGTQEVYKLSDALVSGGFSGFVGAIGEFLADGIVQVTSYGPQVVSIAEQLVASFLAGIQNNAETIASGAMQIGASFISGIIRITPGIIQTGAQILDELLKGAATQMPELAKLATEAIDQFNSGTITALPSIASSAVNIATTLAQGLGDFIPALITAGADAIVAIADGLAGGSPELITATEEAISKIMDAVVQAAPKLLQAGLTLAQSIGKGLMNGVSNFFTDLGNGNASLSQGVAAFAPLVLIGGKIAPVFTKAANSVRAFAPVLKNLGSKAGSAFQALANFPSIAKQFVVDSGGMGNAISSLAKGGLSKIGGMLKAIVSPAGIAVAAIAVLTAAFLHLWNTNEGFRNAISGIWNQITSTIINFGQSIVASLNSVGFNFQNITQVASAIWNGFCSLLAPVFVGAFQAIANTVQEITGVIAGIIQVVASAINGDWSGAMQGIEEVTSSVWNFVLNTIDTIGSTICGVINAFLGLIGVDWQVSWDNIKSAADSVWAEIETVVQGGLSLVQGIFSVVMDIIHGDWSGAWQTIQDAASSAADALPGLISGGLSLMQSVISDIGGTLGSLLDSGWELLKSAASSAADALPDAVSGGLNALSSVISTAGSALGSLLDAGWEALKSAAASAVDALPDAVSGGLSALGNALSTAGETIGPLLDSGWESLKSAASSAADALPGLISGGLSLMQSAISDIGGTLGSLLDSGWELLKSTASAAADAMPGLIQEGFTAMTTSISGIGDGLGSLLDSGWELLKSAASSAADAVKSAWEGVKDFFGGIWDAITGGGKSTEVSAPTVNAGSVQAQQMTVQVDASAIEAANAAVQALQVSIESTIVSMAGMETGFSNLSTASLQLTDIQANVTASTISWSASIQKGMMLMQTATRSGIMAMKSTFQNGFTSMSTNTTTSFTLIITTVKACMTQSKVVVSSTVTMITATISAGVIQIQSVVVAGMSQLVSAVSSGCSQALGIAQSTAGGIYGTFAGVSLYGTGVNMMSGLVNGINAMRGAVMAAAASVASAASAAVNSTLKIHSPSRVMVESGKFTGQGLVIGMQDMRGAIQAEAQRSLAVPIQDAVAPEAKSLEMPIFNKSSVIKETIQNFTGEKSNGLKEGSKESSPTFVFSPTYQFNGDAPNKKDIQDANRMSQREFEKLMKEYLNNKGRVAFG